MRYIALLICTGAFATSAWFVSSDVDQSPSDNKYDDTTPEDINASTIDSVATSMPAGKTAATQNKDVAERSAVSVSDDVEQTGTKSPKQTPPQVQADTASVSVSLPPLAITAQSSSEISESAEAAAEQINTYDSVVATDQAATHKQSHTIEIKHDDHRVELNTFALDRNGFILACVDPPVGAATQASEADDSNPIAGYLQVYSPEGKLTRETALPFRPTAVNEAPDGSVIVAGTGKIARVSADGKILSTIGSPHLGSVEDLESHMAAEAETLMNDRLEQYRKRVDDVAERITEIEETAAEDRTSRQEALLKSLPQQKESYERQLERMRDLYSRSYSPEALLRRKKTITALAVTSRDVFITTYAIEGTGYEIWRTTHELKEPTRIVTGLRGCCGQCDVQTAGENLIVGENTKFNVAVLDRDGNRLSDFGDADRASINGFGSCCNPMNVRCCRNGDILTGEASVGNIKRFSPEGEYLGLVGKAKISGGCKHVAIGFDEERDRYYMMNVGTDRICVLVPLAEAPEHTESERAAKQALAIHGARLLGTWAAEPDPAAGRMESRTVTIVKEINGRSVTEQREVIVSASNRYIADEYTFHADGRLEMKGSSWEADTCRWEALAHDETSIRLALIRNEVHSYDFVISFDEVEQATISLWYKTTSRGGRKFKRTCSTAACEEETETPAPAAQPKA